jgi:hypothetical protein
MRAGAQSAAHARVPFKRVTFNVSFLDKIYKIVQDEQDKNLVHPAESCKSCLKD